MGRGTSPTRIGRSWFSGNRGEAVERGHVFDDDLAVTLGVPEQTEVGEPDDPGQIEIFQFGKGAEA